MCKPRPTQFTNRFPVGEWPDQFVQDLGLARVVSGGKSQTEWRNGQPPDLRPLWGDQMMNFVKNQQPEAPADLSHPTPGAMVSDNRYLTKIVYALADKADFNVESVAQSLMPLAEQIERRRDDESRTRCRSDGFDRDDRLPGAGWQNHYAALIHPSPCRDGLILIIIELNFRSWLKAQPSWVVMTGAVGKRDFPLSQPEDG